MKLSTFVFAGIGAVASVAHAQSSVTLYGIVDGGFTYTSNAKGSHQYALTTGNEGSNRWGLTGSEDLGGGLKAIFTLEAGFNLGNGTIAQNGTEFGRQAFVGLTSSRYGTVTLGRQYSTASTAVGALTAGGSWAANGAGYGAHPADADNLDSFNRVANAIRYQSNNYGGFAFGGMYSLGGKPGQFSQNEIWDLNATYANGPVKLAAGYLFVKDPNFSFWGNKANDSATASNISSPVIAGYASADSEQVISVGGAYTIGLATIGAAYSNTQFQNLGSVTVAGLTPVESAYRGTASINTGELSFKYQVSPALLLGASYAYMRNAGANALGSATYQQADLGAIYAISQRTSVYAIGVYQRARGTDSTGGPAVAAIAGATPSSTNSQTVVTVGLTHKF
ncbi:porin [Paraburkholderia sp.]|uniref:porin n=1 Tax=Paraburkholderia sp. TaxID=1926495 RepID=UPI0039E450DC